MATFSFTFIPKTLTPLHKPLTALTPSHPCLLPLLLPLPRLTKRVLLLRSRPRSGSVGGGGGGGEKEQKDSIMLPGCDYNHWLIVMEFPKDPSPTREEMIETYLNTLASVLGSMEEAKKNMYAFSTTTYTGFQCTVDEETSEKFKGLPGVLWVLPDSYIDVKNKDYGGDKYINGEIIPSKYPTYQPRQRNTAKFENKRYERRRDGPPGSRRPAQVAQRDAPSQSPST